jgi:TonB family protein
MTTAQGTAQGTTIEEHPSAPIAPQPPAGPVSISGVPASVAPLLPGYPTRAEAEGREGTVVALVVTDTLGQVVDLRIEKSAGRDFDESVRRAALASRFVVPRREGKALAVAFRMPYRFRLD